MKKIIECYTADLPLGSSITDDIFNSKGALLIKGGTEVTKRIISLLRGYHGKIRIIIDMHDDVVINCDNTEE